MSIIDGMPTKTQMQEAIKHAFPIAKGMLEAMELGPKQKRVFELMQQGMTLADIYALTDQDCDAIYTHACQLLQAGNIEKGRQWLTVLSQVNPFDTRPMYAFATIHQTEGNVSAAAKLYMHFLATDPTNIEAHLRLGECFLSAREYDKALERFNYVRKRCNLGKGSPEAAALADRLMVHTSIRIAEQDAA